MSYGKLRLCISIIICSFTPLLASDSLSFINNLNLGMQLKYGTMLPHHKSIEYLLESNIAGIEVSLTTDSYGRSVWDKQFRYPRLGAGFLYTSLGNNEIFGRASALFLFSEIPFSSKDRRFSTHYRIGLGLAYISKGFDSRDNPLNMAIGSGVNMYIDFKLNIRCKVNENNELSAGLGFSHFSSGKMDSPNQGLNSASLSLGYKYKLLPEKHKKNTPETMPELKKHAFEILFSCGGKTDDRVSGKRYFISTFVLDYKYVAGYKYAFGIGADFFHDQSLGPNKQHDEGGGYTSADLYQIGMHGGFYVRYSKMNIILQAGTYLHANYYNHSIIYSRTGIRYEIIPNVLLNLSLKAHYAIADFVEWGIGYRF